MVIDNDDDDDSALLQMCFWRGNMEDGHRDDVFKEYSMWKTPGKPSGLRRSMRCVPQGEGGGGAGAMKRLPKFPDRPEPPLNLANIVPASQMSADPGTDHMRRTDTGAQLRPEQWSVSSVETGLSRREELHMLHTQ